MTENCDIVGDNVKQIKKKDKESCLSECTSLDKCKAAVFITSWNMCFLKGSVKRKVNVIMSSSLKNGSIQKGLDYSGKDLSNHVEPTAKACLLRCNGMDSCTGITYIGGYDTCWIKHTQGKLYPKKFYCYQK